MKNRKPSMRDVARLANVSVSAVSLVVRNRPGISEETRARVRAAIATLGYTTSDAAPAERAPVVGLLIEQGTIPAIFDIFYGEVIRGFQTEAQRLGYQVLLHMYARGQESFDQALSTLAGDAQGFVIANDGDIMAEMVVRAEQTRLPLVLIETYLPGHRLPCVIGDNFTAGHTVTRHLLALGHRKIALLRGPARYSSLTDRLHGCMAALAEAGIQLPAEWMPPPSEDPFQRGYRQLREILRLPDLPTAIVTVHDKIAFGAMEAIREAGLRIPEDIALASIDDVAESAHTRPPLTSFHIPRGDIGLLAMQKLHRLIRDDPEIAVKSIVYGDLVVRGSCGAAVAPALQRAELPAAHPQPIGSD